MKPQVLGKGIMLNMRQHTNTHSRPVITASLLLAVILPASLIAGGLAAADTATSEPVVAGARASHSRRHRGGGVVRPLA